MKYIILTFMLVFTLSEVISQVGINTANPQQEVHVAGSIENVRIDGLNETYNINNFGDDSTTRVYVNASGDLILGSLGDDGFEILVDTDNYLNNDENPTSQISQVGTGLGYNPAGILNDPSFVFTLTDKAILEINYSVTWSIYHVQTLKKKRIDDQRSKIIQTGVYFRPVDSDGNYGAALIVDGNNEVINGLGVNNDIPWCIDTTPTGDNCLEWGGLIALNGQFYNNAHKERGSYLNFKNTASDFIILDAGTYVALFAGRMEVDDTSGSGESRIYLGSGNDEMQIIAYYFN